jgi:hypothetical protein
MRIFGLTIMTTNRYRSELADAIEAGQLAERLGQRLSGPPRGPQRPVRRHLRAV